MPISCSRSSRCDAVAPPGGDELDASSVIRSRTRCEYGHHSAWKNSSTVSRRSSGLTNSSNVGAVAARHRGRRDRADARGAADAHRQRHLAEVVAGPEQRPLAPRVLRDRQQPAEHDVEARAELALADDLGPGGHVLAVHRRRQLRQLLAGQLREQADPRQLGDRRGREARAHRASPSKAEGCRMRPILAAWASWRRGGTARAAARELSGTDGAPRVPRLRLRRLRELEADRVGRRRRRRGARPARPPPRTSRTPAAGISRAASSRRASTRSTGCDASCARRPGPRSSPATSSASGCDRYGDADDAPATLNLYWTARIVAGEPAAGRRRHRAPLVRSRRAARARRARVPPRRGAVSLAAPARVARAARSGTRAGSRRAPARRRRPPCTWWLVASTATCVAGALLPCRTDASRAAT